MRAMTLQFPYTSNGKDCSALGTTNVVKVDLLQHLILCI